MKKFFYFLWPVLALILPVYIFFVTPWFVGLMQDTFIYGDIGNITDFFHGVHRVIILFLYLCMLTTVVMIPGFFLLWPEIILHIFLEYPIYACIVYSLFILFYIWWFKQPRWLSGIAVLLISAFAGPTLGFILLGLTA